MTAQRAFSAEPSSTPEPQPQAFLPIMADFLTKSLETRLPQRARLWALRNAFELLQTEAKRSRKDTAAVLSPDDASALVKLWREALESAERDGILKEASPYPGLAILAGEELVWSFTVPIAARGKFGCQDFAKARATVEMFFHLTAAALVQTDILYGVEWNNEDALCKLRSIIRESR